MVVRVKYDRSNRICIQSTGNRPFHAVAQRGGGYFSLATGPPLAPALAKTQKNQQLLKTLLK